MKISTFIKRLNEREVNNTQIEICWDITWCVNRKKYFCLFSERRIDKQKPDGASTGVTYGTWKQQGQGCVPGHVLPGEISIVPNRRTFADIVVGEFK